MGTLGTVNTEDGIAELIKSSMRGLFEAIQCSTQSINIMWWMRKSWRRSHLDFFFVVATEIRV